MSADPGKTANGPLCPSRFPHSMTLERLTIKVSFTTLGGSVTHMELTLACGWYDRIEPLRDGRVKPRGIDLRVETIEDPRVLFDRFVHSNEYDAAEMSSAEHMIRTAAGDDRFVALPVFTSRMFRHSFICINRNAGISGPKDLAGKQIGVPLFPMSAAIWCRGLLRDEFGVDLSGVTWVEGSIDHPGSHGISKPTVLPGIKIVTNTSDRSLSQLLEDGEISATVGALMPNNFGQSPNIARLFQNFREMEASYYKKTGIHPIMHLIVLRRHKYEQAPWIAASLYKAFVEAKAIALSRMLYTGAPKAMLPFLHAEVEETLSLFGTDPWPDGLAGNRRTLDTAIRYLQHDQLIDRAISADALFTDEFKDDPVKQ